MIASNLLNFRCFCAMRLLGKSQVGFNPICVSSEGPPYIQDTSDNKLAAHTFFSVLDD
jgi:hypothetical protein